jgi:hypothetical protein
MSPILSALDKTAEGTGRNEPIESLWGANPADPLEEREAGEEEA